MLGLRYAASQPTILKDNRMRIQSVSIVLLIALIAAQGAFAQPPDCGIGRFSQKISQVGAGRVLA